MGMMARMRSLAPWFIITVGGLFVIFMVFSDTRMGGIFGKNEVVVGKIAGEEITAQEFSTFVENYIKQAETQSGRKIEEDQMDYYRDQCWNMLVAKKLFEQKAKDWNIVVTDDEIRELILGANPPAELAQQFIDSTGKFNRALYEQTLKDPRSKDQLIYIESVFKKQLESQKFQNYLFSSINVSEDELRRQYEDAAVKMRADYVLFDISSVPDAEIKVADDDLRNYYNKHLSDYKVDAQRKIKYVLFPRKATAQDSARIKQGLLKNIAKLQKDTSSLKSLISAYSDYPYSQDTINVTALPAQAKNVLFNAKVNEFTEPVATSEGYTVYHLVARVKGKDPVVRASHILVRLGSDENAAKAKADDIYNQLQKGGNFAELAKKYSEDPGSAANGGDAGWATKGSWVKEFSDAAFGGKIGVIQKPVKSSFGYHIIKTTDRSDDRFVVEKIANKIQPSSSTTARITRNANDLVKLAADGDFQKQAEMLKLNVVETPAFTEKSNFIPGLGMVQSIIRFAFDNSTGAVSDVYKISSGYIVAYVSADIKAGVKSFDELKETIKTSVVKEKKLEKMMKLAADAKSKLGGNNDLKAITGFYPNLKADTTTEFSGSVYPNVGRDFAFIHYCKTAELNKVSAPVKGLKGAYLIKPTSRSQFSQQDYAAQRNSIRDKVLQTKKGQIYNQWITALKEDTKIVDERYKYFKQ